MRVWVYYACTRILLCYLGSRSHEGTYQAKYVPHGGAVEIKQYISFSHCANENVLRQGGKKMKQKILIVGLCFTLALSLVGCGAEKVQETQPAEDVQPSETVISEPPVTAQPMEVQQDVETPAEVSQGVEDKAGDSGSEEPTALDVELFTDCNETVYATGTVNIRASWTAESEKLGSLGAGESVTRIGTGKVGTDAEGWSKVSLADGSVAYISTSYLSTTKPVTQNISSGSTGGTSNTGGTTSTSGTTGGTTQTADGIPPEILNDPNFRGVAGQGTYGSIGDGSGMAQIYQGSGMSTGNVDHPWTEEEKAALQGAISSEP